MHATSACHSAENVHGNVHSSREAYILVFPAVDKAYAIEVSRFVVQVVVLMRVGSE